MSISAFANCWPNYANKWMKKKLDVTIKLTVEFKLLRFIHITCTPVFPFTRLHNYAVVLFPLNSVFILATVQSTLCAYISGMRNFVSFDFVFGCVYTALFWCNPTSPVRPCSCDSTSVALRLPKIWLYIVSFDVCFGCFNVFDWPITSVCYVIVLECSKS